MHNHAGTQGQAILLTTLVSFVMFVKDHSSHVDDNNKKNAKNLNQILFPHNNNSEDKCLWCLSLFCCFARILFFPNWTRNTVDLLLKSMKQRKQLLLIWYQLFKPNCEPGCLLETKFWNMKWPRTAFPRNGTNATISHISQTSHLYAENKKSMSPACGHTKTIQWCSHVVVALHRSIYSLNSQLFSEVWVESLVKNMYAAHTKLGVFANSMSQFSQKINKPSYFFLVFQNFDARKSKQSTWRCVNQSHAADHGRFNPA